MLIPTYHIHIRRRATKAIAHTNTSINLVTCFTTFAALIAPTYSSGFLIEYGVDIEALIECGVAIEAHKFLIKCGVAIEALIECGMAIEAHKFLIECGMAIKAHEFKITCTLNHQHQH